MTTDDQQSAAAMQAAALAAIPGYPEATAALAAVDDRLQQLHEPDPAPVDAAALTVLLLAGEPIPDDLGAQLSEHAERIAARHREMQLLATVRDGLGRRRDSALRDGNAAAFQWLDQHLQVLVRQGREVLARLGAVRTAEQALDADDPRAARDDLRELGALAERHKQLREAQIVVLGAVAGVSSRHLTWSGQLTLVRDRGLVANPDTAGAPPQDPLAWWLWLLDSPAVPAVPTYAELMRRADPGRLTATPQPPPAAPGAALPRRPRR